jgi:hypothetical protein
MIDERFLAHRYKATRLATMVGAILMFVFFTYDLVTRREIRWELILIMCAMAATKVLAMFYYKRTN